MSPFNQTRNIRHDEAAFFFGFSDRHDAEVRLQSREGIVGNLRPRRRDARDQRGLSNIGITDQPYIGEQLEFQAEDALFAGASLFMLARGLMRGRGKARVPSTTAPAAGNHDALIGVAEVVDFVAGFGVVHNRSHRDLQQNIHAFASLAVRTFAVASAFRLVFRIETEVHQSVVTLARFHNYVAAIAAVAPGWPTPRNILLPAKSKTAVASVPSLHPNCGFIDKHKG